MSVRAPKKEASSILGMAEYHETAFVFAENGDRIARETLLDCPGRSGHSGMQGIPLYQPRGFVYCIAVNGENIAVRTYEFLVQAKCSYLAEIPPALVPGCRLAVSINFSGGSEMGILRGFAYRSLDQNVLVFCLPERGADSRPGPPDPVGGWKPKRAITAYPEKNCRRSWRASAKASGKGRFGWRSSPVKGGERERYPPGSIG